MREPAWIAGVRWRGQGEPDDDSSGLIKGGTIGVDSTTLEANAAMKSIVRRDTGESYMADLKRLAEAEGIEAKDSTALLRMGRKRKKKSSNEDWQSPVDG